MLKVYPHKNHNNIYFVKNPEKLKEFLNQFLLNQLYHIHAIKLKSQEGHNKFQIRMEKLAKSN